MLLIECPWCGPRAESEFTCGGEADIARPLETDKLTDEEWGDYLFMRHNPRGEHREQWLHAQGCRRWFKVTRDTVTYAIHGYETFGPDTTGASAAGGAQEHTQGSRTR
ncbi:sarcosine oxidase subunit delta [Paraburkholderia sp. B3]|uniref:sarcosine oxidase subunit delta n=1 Tax=Paraburkholderia sp. B3 TaxID=3134791 RepID=UPI0039827C89